MSSPFLIAKGPNEVFFYPKMANRHGLIAGATGSGKTITLQGFAENFSALGPISKVGRLSSPPSRCSTHSSVNA